MDPGKDAVKNVTEAVSGGWIDIGHFIEDFENGFANFLGSKHGIACFNGTVALHLAMVAYGIKRGDEVIVPSLSFVGCANMVRLAGATPIFADAHPDYWCVDPKSIEEKITKRTKAIMPVHLYGHPCDMDPILKLAKEHDLMVLEDSAEAHGAEYKGKKCGSIGTVGTFSFHVTKIITCGQGGICMTNDDKLDEDMRILRAHGAKPQYRGKFYYDMVGFNYKMTNMQAAIGCAQMGKLKSLVEKRRWTAKIYAEAFEDARGIVGMPEMKWAKNLYWFYCILVDKKIRDKVMVTLEKEGIVTRPFFVPLSTLPMYKTKEKFKVAEDIGAGGINLPSSPNLTEKQIVYIAEAVKRAVKT